MISVISGILPLGLFMFYRKWLDNTKHFKVLIFISLTISVIGVLSSKTDPEYFMLIIPLYSLLVYKGLFFLFKNHVKRAPIDTSYNWGKGLFWDRMFNIGFVCLGFMLPYFLLLLLIYK